MSRANALLPPCPICKGRMARDLMPEVSRCASCGYFASTLPVAINENRGALDEDRRMDALAAIRRENFTTILGRLQATEGFPRQANALEVGCGHGWFLEILTKRGYRAAGLEPDMYIAGIAQRAGHDVTIGVFPDALDTGTTFDAIFFNDVFEHMPNVNAVAESLKRHTGDRGWAVINLPVSGGIIFRIARLLARVGNRGPYRRLWQADMPSPHLSYFSASNIEKLFEKHGFELVVSARLRSITSKGLLDRVRYDRKLNPVAAYLYYLGALLLLPALALLPADIMFFAFRKLPPPSPAKSQRPRPPAGSPAHSGRASYRVSGGPRTEETPGDPGQR